MPPNPEFYFLNYVCGCFAYIDICVLHICLVLMEVKRRHQITGTEISDKIISCCVGSENQTLVLQEEQVFVLNL